MFDVAIQFMIQLIQIIPLFVCIILVFNLVSSMLWGDR